MHVPYIEQLKHFHAEEIEEALRANHEVSLCADTTRPRPPIRFYEDADIEVRVARYPNFAACAPLRHRGMQEFRFVAQGAVKVLLLSGEQEHSFSTGSLFIVESGMRYCMKCMPGTTLFTFMIPDDYGLPDQELPVSDTLRVWMGSWSGNPVLGTVEGKPLT